MTHRGFGFYSDLITLSKTLFWFQKMSDCNHEAITNTNSKQVGFINDKRLLNSDNTNTPQKRVSIVRNSGNRYLILNQSDGLRPVWIAGGLGEAMAAAYENGA